MKVAIDRDEWWPVFTIETDPEQLEDADQTYDIDDATLERTKKANEEFEATQKILEAIFYGRTAATQFAAPMTSAAWAAAEGERITKSLKEAT